MINLDKIGGNSFYKSDASTGRNQLGAVGQSVSRSKIRDAVLEAYIRQSSSVEKLPDVPNNNYF
jgi:hypothetical protein